MTEPNSPEKNTVLANVGNTLGNLFTKAKDTTVNAANKVGSVFSKDKDPQNESSQTGGRKKSRRSRRKSRLSRRRKGGDMTEDPSIEDPSTLPAIPPPQSSPQIPEDEEMDPQVGTKRSLNDVENEDKGPTPPPEQIGGRKRKHRKTHKKSNKRISRKRHSKKRHSKRRH